MKKVIIDERILKNLVETAKGFVRFVKDHNVSHNIIAELESSIEVATKLLEEE